MNRSSPTLSLFRCYFCFIVIDGRLYIPFWSNKGSMYEPFWIELIKNTTGSIIIMFIIMYNPFCFLMLTTHFDHLSIKTPLQIITQSHKPRPHLLISNCIFFFWTNLYFNFNYLCYTVKYNVLQNISRLRTVWPCKM